MNYTIDLSQDTKDFIKEMLKSFAGEMVKADSEIKQNILDEAEKQRRRKINPSRFYKNGVDLSDGWTYQADVDYEREKKEGRI